MSKSQVPEMNEMNVNKSYHTDHSDEAHNLSELISQAKDLEERIGDSRSSITKKEQNTIQEVREFIEGKYQHQQTLAECYKFFGGDFDRMIKGLNDIHDYLIKVGEKKGDIPSALISADKIKKFQEENKIEILPYLCAVDENFKEFFYDFMSDK